MSSLLQDLRYAARRLARAPVFTICTVAILGVGIGLNTAVFNLVDATAFRPAPFAEPENIVHIYQDSDDGAPSSTSFPAYREMAATTGAFASVAATSGAVARWDAADGPREVTIAFATASYFDVLGLHTHLGTWFSPEHDVVGAELVAVLSHRAWRTQFASDPGVVGRAVRLNNQPVTIIGVGPTDFNGMAGALITDFWLSISSTPVGGPFRVANLDRPQDHWYQVEARLAPGVTRTQAQAAMDGLALRLAEINPDVDVGRGITVFAADEVRFHPAVDTMVFASTTALLVLAAVVLLLACSNLANLFLARGIARGPEVAVRSALGAGWLRVARLLLCEALLTALLGGAVGLAVAAVVAQVVPSLPLPTVGGAAQTLDVRFDHRLVLFGVLAALATGLFFGLIPALRAARSDVVAMLRDEGRGHSAAGRVSLLRKALVAVQVALSVVLIVAAGLMARSLANAERVALGVDAERIAILGTILSQGGVGQDEAAAVTAEILARIATLPGVERAALTTRLPVQPGGSSTTVVDGYTPAVGTGAVELPAVGVSREYFDTMGIRLVAGRSFSTSDNPDGAPVVIVNETAARLFWNGDAVGRRLRPQDDPDAWREVVGVVADVKVADVTEPPTPMFYFSTDQIPPLGFTVVAKASGDPALLAEALRVALREVRPSLPVTRQGSFEATVAAGFAGARIGVALIGGFSLLALVLAGLGVYAVVSFNVERRTQELGVRMALGATHARLARMVVGECVLVVAIGVVVGSGLAALGARGLSSVGVLFGVAAIDSATFAGAAALLLSTAAAAAFLPAYRAARANPVDALRTQ
jgi:predicted permease